MYKVFLIVLLATEMTLLELLGEVLVRSEASTIAPMSHFIIEDLRSTCSFPIGLIGYGGVEVVCEVEAGIAPIVRGVIRRVVARIKHFGVLVVMLIREVVMEDWYGWVCGMAKVP